MVTVVTKVRLLTVVGMRQCVLPSSCPTVVGSWDRRIKEMVTVVTKVRLLTVVGMRQCVLPSSCLTVVGSWDRKYPFGMNIGCIAYSGPGGRAPWL